MRINEFFKTQAAAQTASRISRTDDVRRQPSETRTDWQKPSQREQDARTSTQAEQNHRSRAEEQQHTSRFQELLNGSRYEQATHKNAPPTQILENDAAQARNEFSRQYQENSQKTASVDSVFWQRDQIDDAVTFKSFSTALPPDMAKNEVRDTDFRRATENFAATNRHQTAEVGSTAPVSSLREPPETRASLLSIVRAQGPGAYLQLFA